MSRHSLSFLVCVGLLSLVPVVFAQPSSPSQPASSLVQVLYIIEGNTIVTYDVDPQTLTPRQAGTLRVNNAGMFYTLVPSPNGHFLYFIAYDAQLNKHLWVFATDANGAPIAPATEEIQMNYLYWLALAPANNFAYLVFDFPTKYYLNNFYVNRYLIDSATGSLSQPVVEAKYRLPNGAGGSEACWVNIDGFNASATKMYDDVNCSFHGGAGDTYYERTFDPQTGALGPDQQIYSWSNTYGGAEYVQFVGSHMFDFVLPNDYQQGIDSVNIDPIVPNTKPVLQCTAQMLEACGYATGVAHPSGQYVFMRISQDSAQIDKVELGAKKIVDTGNYIPSGFGQFSPDGTLVYSYNYSTSSLQVYGFDVSTSAVTAGGSIGLPSGVVAYYAAQRQ